MNYNNKSILEKGNAAIINGDNEGFLPYCADDTEWTFIGDKTLRGKQAVREWMAKTYKEPPKFKVSHMIAEGDFLTAVGQITMKDDQGTDVDYEYCDVWRFHEGKIVQLKAFVIKSAESPS